jgi:uncharacterized protein involved in type VI secretion and phage assembly
MGPMINAIRLQVARAVAERFHSRTGTVQNYDPVNYCVKVLLLPEEILTGNIPLASTWVGNGWGMFCPPSIGDQVVVTFLNGSLDAGYAELRFYDNNNRPLDVPSGEFWLQHVKGQFLKLTNDGKLNLSDAHGATVVLNGDGTISSTATTWNDQGDLIVSANVTAGQNLSAGTGASGVFTTPTGQTITVQNGIIVNID